MNDFTIHIVGSNYSGEIGTFNLEQNFFRKYKDVEKGLSKTQLLHVGRIIQDDIKRACLKWKWKNIASGVILTEVSPFEVIVSIADSQQQKAKWLNFGTERHFIKPKNRQALHWEVPGVNQWGAKFVGGDAFSKGHWVSGIIAYDFFKLSAEARSRVQDYLNKILIFSKN